MTTPPAEQMTASPTAGDTARLEAHVRTRLRGRIHELRIVVHGPGLILRGSVRTYYAKQLVQHVLMEIATLPILANEIEVARLPEQRA
jgi:hypothetical protein